MELISKKGYEKLCEEYQLMDQKIIDTQRKMGESAKRDNNIISAATPMAKALINKHINELIDFNGMKIIIKLIEKI